MPELPNARQERFAQYRAGGLPKVRAYEKAGYKPDAGNASRLTRNDLVRERVQELIDNSLAAENITPELVRRGLLEEALLGESEGARVRSWELLGKGLGMFREGSDCSSAPANITPEEFCESIAEISPEAASILAPLVGVKWRPECDG